jgi:hypothetical protein
VDFPFSFTPAVGDNVYIWTGYLGDMLEAIRQSGAETLVIDRRVSVGGGTTTIDWMGEDP